LVRRDRAIEDVHELSRQRFELDLIAQALGELLECLDRVVFAAVKAAVDEPLDARSQGSGQRATTRVKHAAWAAEASPAGDLQSTSAPQAA
jgi:hypothetical protein